jgi:hypothetical protein
VRADVYIVRCVSTVGEKIEARTGVPITGEEELTVPYELAAIALECYLAPSVTDLADREEWSLEIRVLKDVIVKGLLGEWEIKRVFGNRRAAILRCAAHGNTNGRCCASSPRGC